MRKNVHILSSVFKYVTVPILGKGVVAPAAATELWRAYGSVIQKFLFPRRY